MSPGTLSVCRAARLVLVLLLGSAGCGGGEPQLTPVRGTVYYQGAPLKGGGIIVFTADSERGCCGEMAQAEIAEDGTYALRTGNEPGALAGWYRISLIAGSPGQPSPIPHRYCDPDLSRLCREVESGHANVIDLHLE